MIGAEWEYRHLPALLSIVGDEPKQVKGLAEILQPEPSRPSENDFRWVLLGGLFNGVVDDRVEHWLRWKRNHAD